MDNQGQQLLSILNLQQKGQDDFLGISGNSLFQRVFGGHVIAQAVTAAQKTINNDRFIHSLHAYFLRPGDPNQPIDYQVERLRDGRSFSARHVTAIQYDTPIFTASCSFQIDEPGLNYQRPMIQNITPPEALNQTSFKQQDLAPDIEERLDKYWKMMRPFIIKPINLENYIHRETSMPRLATWFKLDMEITESRNLNAALLAYLSDMTALDTALSANKTSVFSTRMSVASIDHAIWFHRPFSFNDWLLYEVECASTSNARGMVNGYIYTREGTLVASIAQEGLMRTVGY